MSGALNPDMMGWKLPPEMANNMKRAFGAIWVESNPSIILFIP